MIQFFLVAFLGSIVASLNSMTGQALTNRPIVLGPLVGLIMGDVVQGTIIGATLELAYMGVMVIGISTSVNMAVAAILGTAYAITTGQGPEMAVTLAIPCSLLFTLVGQALTPVKQVLCRIGLSQAEKGDCRKFELWHYLIWCYGWVVNGIVYFLALSLGSAAVEGLVNAAPEAIISGLRAATTIIPALGFGMLLNLCMSKETIAFFFIGFVFSVYIGVDNVGVAVIAAAFALIAFFFGKSGNNGEEEEMEVAAPGSENRLLDKKTLNKIYWRSYQLEADFGYERFQGAGFAYSMIPAIEKLYSDPADVKEALNRHTEFFNTTPTCVTLITGIACAMEEQKAKGEGVNGEAISAVKVALMGPVAGIGDAIFWGSYRIVCASIACQMGLTGNIFAPFMFLILFNIPNVLIHYFGLMKTYELGSNAIGKLYASGVMDKVALCCSIMGMTMIGAMTASLVGIRTALSFTVGDSVIVLQEVLDSIMPELLSLGAVFGLAGLMKKKQPNVTLVVMSLMVVGIIGAWVGFF